MAKKNMAMRILCAYAVALLVLQVLLVMASWVASIYVDGVYALLAPRGIRWMCSSIVDNFASAPLAPSLMALMTVSLMQRSGVYGIFSDRLSLRKRRAAHVTAAVGATILLVFSLLLFLPNAVLLSAFGTISHSSLAHGWYGLLVLYVSAISLVYGYASGCISSMADILDGGTPLAAQFGSYLLLAFLASQLVGALGYTELLRAMGDDGIWMETLSIVLYYAPLAAYIFLPQMSRTPHSSHSGD